MTWGNSFGLLVLCTSMESILKRIPSYTLLGFLLIIVSIQFFQSLLYSEPLPVSSWAILYKLSPFSIMRYFPSIRHAFAEGILMRLLQINIIVNNLGFI